MNKFFLSLGIVLLVLTISCTLLEYLWPTKYTLKGTSRGSGKQLGDFLPFVAPTAVTADTAPTDAALAHAPTNAQTRIGKPYKVFSVLGKYIEAHQANCGLPTESLAGLHDWKSGLGSQLHIWGQAVCNALEKGHRMRFMGNWFWVDKTHCTNNATVGCYFPLNETRCPARAIEDKIVVPVLQHCPSIINDRVSKELYRAAATEYLFSQGLSNFVLEEVANQMQQVFNQTFAPPDLITVHIRWGDKFQEMKLVQADEYVSAVKAILLLRAVQTAVNIYVSTEDPLGTAAFRAASPPTWNVYGDAMVEKMRSFRPEGGNHANVAAIASRGLEGTQALASLVIAMEANEFVLTTASNWSRLMNELRTNVIDPRCGNCTSMTDMRKGQWRRK